MRARGTTKTAIGKAAGHSAAWAIRWLDGDYAAGLQELEKIADLFGQPIAALFSDGANARETEWLNLFRALTPRRQDLALELIREWTNPAPLPRSSR